MKRYKIGFIILSLVAIAYISSPNVTHVDYSVYENLGTLKELAVKNNKEALKKLMGYYAIKGDEKAAFLVRCAYNNSDQECPNNPIRKIEETDKIQNFIGYSIYKIQNIVF